MCGIGSKHYKHHHALDIRMLRRWRDLLDIFIEFDGYIGAICLTVYPNWLGGLGWTPPLREWGTCKRLRCGGLLYLGDYEVHQGAMLNPMNLDLRSIPLGCGGQLVLFVCSALARHFDFD